MAQGPLDYLPTYIPWSDPLLGRGARSEWMVYAAMTRPGRFAGVRAAVNDAAFISVGLFSLLVPIRNV